MVKRSAIWSSRGSCSTIGMPGTLVLNCGRYHATAAMAAGVTDRLWTFRDYARLARSETAGPFHAPADRMAGVPTRRTNDHPLRRTAVSMRDWASLGIKLIGAYFLGCAVYEFATLMPLLSADRLALAMDMLSPWDFSRSMACAVIGFVMIWGTKECLFVMNVPFPETPGGESEDDTSNSL